MPFEARPELCDYSPRTFPFRISQQVQKQLDRLTREQERRVAEGEGEADPCDDGEGPP